MKSYTLFPVISLITVLCILAAGCTESDADADTPTATGTQTQMPTPSPTPVPAGDNGDYSLDDSLPIDMEVIVGAVPVSKTALLVNYNLDLSVMGSAMKQDGWNIIVTSYAYNPGDMEPGFYVAGYDDIISSGIPYKSRNIHVYPGNIYPDKIEVSDNPDTGVVIDTDASYNYGVVLREA